MKKKAFTLFIMLCLLAGCQQPMSEEKNRDKGHGTLLPPGPPDVRGERYAMVTGLKPEKVAYYKKLHEAVWPLVLKKITECNIRNYSIYLKEVDGKPYLFSYWEYIGRDFDADMKKMAADTATQRWWKETAPAQVPLPDAAAERETWSRMTEVFHQD